MFHPSFLTRQPALLIGQTPEKHSHHGWLLQHLFQIVLVHRRHIAILLRDVFLPKAIVIDVELRDKRLELSLVQLLDEVVNAVAELCDIARAQMGLDPHGLEWRMHGLQAIDQRQDGCALCQLLRRVVLKSIVVIGEDDVRIGCARCTERDLDVLSANQIEPGRGPHAVRPAILDPDGFIDDVPAVDAAFIAGDDRMNMLRQDRLRILLGDCRLKPVRQILMPAQIVPAHLQLVFLRKGHQGICLFEVEGRSCGPQRRPLHAVLSNDHVELFGDHSPVAWLLLQQTHVDGTPDQQPARLRMRPQRSSPAGFDPVVRIPKLSRPRQIHGTGSVATCQHQSSPCQQPLFQHPAPAPRRPALPRHPRHRFGLRLLCLCKRSHRSRHAGSVPVAAGAV